MIIEPGDYFVVKRGNQLRPRSEVFAIMTGFPCPNPNSEPEYDCSYNGMVFQCLASECGLVVGVAVHGQWEWRKSEKRDIFNQDEVVLETVSKSFAASLGVDVSETSEKTQ